MKTILTIAGLDPAGGAGLFADIKTIAAHGNHGVGVITATTAQNTVGVDAVYPLSAEAVCSQLNTLHKDIEFSAAKTGMLYSLEIVEELCNWLHKHWITPLVVDPVLASSSGHSLSDSEIIDTMKIRLFPLATVITPNLDEASKLTGKEVENIAQMEIAAKILYSLGPRYILIKGGHLKEEATDILYDGEEFLYFSATRLPVNTHGTGCTFSAALASLLGSGFSVTEAVERSKHYVRTVMLKTLKIGHGKELLGHLPLETLRKLSSE